MSNDRLTPVSYLVLGLVASGASTSYQLKQKVAGSVGYMWSFPHSALYAEPARLVEMGMLSEEREHAGRHRRVFSITEMGKETLTTWLREPTFEPTQLRDLGLLKLFFAGFVDEADVVILAADQEKVHRERLAVYEAYDAEIPVDSTTLFPRATLKMGLKVERAFVSFWRELGGNPAER